MNKLSYFAPRWIFRHSVHQVYQKYVLFSLIVHHVPQKYVLILKIDLVSIRSSQVTWYYDVFVTSSN
eukprot:UN02184